LENVGYTARHHTFFEMLGNFSFGDYFKKTAIELAWEFLTQHLNLSPQKLWITVHKDDHEAKSIWLDDIGVDPSRFSMLGDKDNYWSMGETGPCGPCSEIFYDHGENIFGSPPGTPDEEGDRYIEIWNLVFMQYDRDVNGKLHPLPSPSVDTGMGLERISAIMQGKHNNYEIDLFEALISDISRHFLSIIPLEKLNIHSVRVIADHIRSCSFLILDGILPSNEGRGYVLRRIIRRAIRHGHQLGVKNAFFYKIYDALSQIMGKTYPELCEQANKVKAILQQEEKQFSRTLEQGLKLLNTVISDLKTENKTMISGKVLFKLYDTYGFPMDLTADIAREHALSIDEKGFSHCMAQQQARARNHHQFSSKNTSILSLDFKTSFLGYSSLTHEAELIAIIVKNEKHQTLSSSNDALLVLNQTVFYAESGGQVGDKGILKTAKGAVFKVTNTKKINQTIVHHGQLLQGELTLFTPIMAYVDSTQRQATANNHSATHLLQATLKRFLGLHVEQKGAYCDEERLRFDFSHSQALTQKQLFEIEHCVNDVIRKNYHVKTKISTLEQAKKEGITFLSAEKYSEQVRVLSIASFSVELCGGTHVHQTGNIGCFKIINEQGVASGIRRIEAVTGKKAIQTMQIQTQTHALLSEQLKTPPHLLNEKLTQYLEHSKLQEKTIEQLNQRWMKILIEQLLKKAILMNHVKYISAEIEGLEPSLLRTLSEQLCQQLDSGIVLLALKGKEKIHVISVIDQELTQQYHAGKLVKAFTKKIKGKGGGRPDMAQGGGSHLAALPLALSWVSEWVKMQ
jgi:alanyl-tRNA synthetase